MLWYSLPPELQVKYPDNFPDGLDPHSYPDED